MEWASHQTHSERFPDKLKKKSSHRGGRFVLVLVPAQSH